MKTALRGFAFPSTRSAIALILPVLAAAIQWLLWPYLHPLVWFLFYPAVFVSAWISGFWGGLGATILSCALVIWLFFPLAGGTADQGTRTAPSVVMFIAVGALFSYAHARQRRVSADHIRLQTRALEATANAMMITTSRGIIEWVNPAFAALTGYDTVEAIGKRPEDLLKSGFHDRDFYSGMWDTILAGQVWRGELQNKKKDGTLYWEEMTITPVSDERGNLNHFVSVKQDVTVRKELIAALEESESRLRQLTDHIRKVFFLVDPRMTHVYYVSPAYEQIFGRSCASLYENPGSFTDGIHPDDRERVLALMAPQATTASFDIEYRVLHTDGSVRWVNTRAFPVQNADGEVYRFAGTVEDITSRRRTEETAALLQRAVTDMLEGIQIIDHDWKYLYVNAVAARQGRSSPQALTGRTMMDCYPGIDDSVLWNELTWVMDHREPRVFQNEFRFPDGESGWFELHIEPDASGILIRSVDITDRKEAEKAMTEANERFRQVVENIDQVFWMTDPVSDRVLYVSPGYEKTWGRSVDELYSHPNQWLEAIHSEDRERIADAARKQADGKYNVEYRVVRPDGTLRWIHDRAFPVHDLDGRVYRIAGVATDVTSRIQLQAQLGQAQRLEAIGRLSGGIAHDFNNLLTVILGNISIMELDAMTVDMKASLQQIKGAAERAGNLTRQLLVYARRQSVQMRHLDLNDSIRDIGVMIHRVLGEDIEMHFHLADVPLLIHADLDMVDQVLMNLVVNARDAMPRGGRLTISTSRKIVTEESAGMIIGSKPGAFCVLTVTDTGSGIPSDILPRIFDPFFTTKDVGKGTGLGLATVFSIMQQHGGWINAYSDPSHGTTFRAYFPAGSQSDARDPVSASLEAVMQGGSESILLIEDEAGIRAIVSAFLRRLGYNVIEASNGPEALEQWAGAQERVKIIFSDIVLPGGMTGVDIAARIIAERPAVRVIYTSGYSELSADVSPSFLQEGVNFLAKPYELSDVALLLRKQLDEPEL